MIVSLLFLLILLPFLILVGFIIFVQDFGPPIFKQYRIGQNGKKFLFYKFRSMPLDTPNVESKDKDQLKITKFGRFIRRTNIDELPQLFNILKGDMSFIGPRPPIPSQKELLSLRKENSALSCKPGLTGWAQVNSYDNMPIEQKAKLDGEYAKKMSFKFDIKVLLKTFPYLLKKPPVY